MIRASGILAAVVVAFSLAGCGSSVVCQDGVCDGSANSAQQGKDGDGGGGQGGSSGSAGASPGTGPTAIVTTDGETATVRVATFGLSCASPGAAPPYGSCNWAQLEISFPVELLGVGPVDPTNPELQTFISEEMAGGQGECGGTAAITGGGQGTGFGQLTIDAIAADSVTVTLGGFDVMFQDQHLDGQRVAARCF